MLGWVLSMEVKTQRQVSRVSNKAVFFFFGGGGWTIFKVFIKFVTKLFYVLVFGQEACQISTPQPGFEHTALECKVFHKAVLKVDPKQHTPSVLLQALGSHFPHFCISPNLILPDALGKAFM